MSTVLETSEAAILGRVFKPETGGWPRAAAEAMLGVSFDNEDRNRMTELLEPGGLTRITVNYRITMMWWTAPANGI